MSFRLRYSVSRVKRKSRTKRVEQILFFVGVLCTLAYVGARVDAFVASRIALAQFERATKGTDGIVSGPGPENKAEQDVDFTLWSQKRINAYEQSLSAYTNSPTAVLEIPKLRLRVPVFDGTDDLTLNRGVGRIPGTVKPEQDGNIGIAGHRDGFFRGLKDLSLGDAINLQTLDAKRTYVIDQITVVTPDDVSVLKSKPKPSLTLVTCYPFYFVGDAPKRYVVSASLKGESPANDKVRFVKYSEH